MSALLYCKARRHFTYSINFFLLLFTFLCISSAAPTHTQALPSIMKRQLSNGAQPSQSIPHQPSTGSIRREQSSQNQVHPSGIFASTSQGQIAQQPRIPSDTVPVHPSSFPSQQNSASQQPNFSISTVQSNPFSSQRTSQGQMHSQPFSSVSNAPPPTNTVPMSQPGVSGSTPGSTGNSSQSPSTVQSAPGQGNLPPIGHIFNPNNSSQSRPRIVVNNTNAITNTNHSRSQPEPVTSNSPVTSKDPSSSVLSPNTNAPVSEEGKKADSEAVSALESSENLSAARASASISVLTIASLVVVPIVVLVSGVVLMVILESLKRRFSRENAFISHV